MYIYIQHWYLATVSQMTPTSAVRPPLGRFSWRKALLLFDRDAYESVAGHHTCYLAMSSLIGLLKTNNVSYGTFDLGQNRRFTLRDNLRAKIGLDYGGEYLPRGRVLPATDGWDPVLPTLWTE